MSTTVPPTLGAALIGGMGAGKTTVGRELAHRTGRPFLDTDALVEADAGRPIQEIFAEEGEAAFRAREARALREAIARGRPQGAILATGGGLPVDPANADALRCAGPVVHLAIDVRRAWARAGADPARPLASQGFEAFAARLEARDAVYRSFPYRVDARRPPEAVALELARRVVGPARKVDVDLGDRAYPILLAPGAIATLGEAMAARMRPGKCLLVTQRAVARHHGAAALASLRAAGWVPEVVEVPPGERAKSLDHARRLYDAALAAGLDRRSPVVALGGGVVGDLAGFVAATYQRGVPFVQVPTTLLAQIDSSVGGKVAVNLPQGKNLVGAFHQPCLVVADPLTFWTLPPREVRAGLAELVKYGVIADAELFARVERDLDAILARDLGVLVPIVARCCEIKAQVVAADEREAGVRAILNFGHTVGHAVEALTGYRTYLHGEAVAMGMVAAGDLAVRMAAWPAADQARLVALLSRIGLPTALPALGREAVMAAMGKDKKVAEGRIRFVLPAAMGAAHLVESVPPDHLDRVLALADRPPEPSAPAVAGRPTRKLPEP